MAQTGALQLRCCTNKNSVTRIRTSSRFKLLNDLFFTHANPLWPQGQHDRPCPWAILSPGRERGNELKLKVLLLFAFDANDRRKKRLQMELFVTLCAPPCSSSVYWQPVITVLTTIGASKCSHLTVIVGNRLQVPSPFLFFLSSPSEESHRSSPPLRMRCAASHVCVVKSFGKQDRYNDLREIITRISLS